MGTGGRNVALSWVLLAFASALFVAGCGVEDHPNEPRPPLPVEVTVTIAEDRLSVQPSSVAFGEDDDQPMSQNEGQPREELSSDRPLTVSFTVSNLTDFETPLQIEGPQSETSNPILGGNPGSFKVDLPTGDYSIVASKVPGTPTTRFSIGADRRSSQNDLLLP